MGLARFYGDGSRRGLVGRKVVIRGFIVPAAFLGAALAACSSQSGEDVVTDCAGRADGTPCEDGDACTPSSACRSGACVALASKPCPEPSELCLTASCDPETGTCRSEPAPDGTVCVEGEAEACVAPSVCTGGVCAALDGGDCPDVGPCEARVWTGSQWAVETAPDGASCDDALPCTRDTTCTAGVCGGGAPVRCTTDNPCARPFCDPAVGCVEELVVDGTPCDDGDLCSLASACSEGACIPTEAVQCQRGPCIEEAFCSPETGRCVVEPKPDGMSCDDRNVCTAGDFCSEGNCIPSELLPWEGEACAEGICFRDVTTQSGVDFIGVPPAVNEHGGPVALFDPDLDGDLDLLVGTETTPLRFYANDGTGRFTEATAAVGLDGVEQSPTQRLFAFAVGDIDNDGDPDLYIGMQDTEDHLFENDGTGRFTDVTATSGLSGTRDTNGADFGDFDADGDLDLYIGHYIRERRFPFHVPEPNALYLNQGDGTFQEVTSQYRVGGGDIGGSGTTLVVRWMDYDRDGDLDLFECNDFGANVGRSRLYENTGDPEPDRRFVDVAPAMNVDLGIYCMSITTGDWDRDADLDLYFTNIGRHELYRNDAPSPFLEVTDVTRTSVEFDQCEVDRLSAGWSALFVDFDHDGWLDLFSANGHVLATDEFENAEETRNSVLRHDGESLTFTDVSRTAMASSTVYRSRGAAAGDLDGDGDQDVVVVNLFGPIEVFENISPRVGGEVFVDVRGTLSNRDGYHAFVTARFEDHERGHEIDPHVGYQGVSEKAAHFGLGDAEQIDEVRVRWPATGIEQSRFDVAAGTRLLVVEAPVTLSGATASGPATLRQPVEISVQFEVHAPEGANAEVWVEDRTGSVSVPIGTGRSSADGPGSFEARLDVTPVAPGLRRLVVGVESGDGAVDEVELELTVSE